MSLSELEKGDKAIILNIDAPKELRQRMKMFGIIRDEILTLKACSLGKQNIEIEIDTTLIALRVDEAERIEVKKI